MKRRFTLLAVATFLSGTLMAAWDGTIAESLPFNGDVCEISTEAQLAKLAADVNAGTNYSGKTFIQTAELDLGNKSWTPIGGKSKQFSGTYDGNGKVIKNLYINKPTTDDYIGLFGGIKNATLKNITVASGFVYGKQYAAGICGFATDDNSVITCCANIATVYGKQERNGGVVAYIEGKTKVNNCINYGLVSAFNYSGGVVGFCNKTTTEVSNCINVGQVFGMRYTTGNCFGYNKDFGCPTSNCYYDNQINASEGWTRVNPIESDLDVANQMEGKPTSVMTSGNKLDDSFSSDNWVFSTGMYPRLKTNYEHPAVVLAATPVSLASGDKADNVTKNFTVSTANSVSWVSGDTENLTISGTSASILKNTGVILTATLEGYTKTVYLKTNKANATAIGSSSSPLTIETKSELAELREAVNNYGSYKGCAAYDGFKGIHFKVTVDIELTDWTEPIGIHNSFKGILDGNHRSIKGINVAQTSHSSVGGLFGCLSYGEIKNITVYGSVKGKELIGGICGATFNEHMTNCVSYCTIDCSGKQQTGGIAGDDRGFSTFTNCENYGTITAGTRSGGILGRSQMGTTLDGCKNFGNVTGNNESIGGICGSIATTTGGGTIKNCENHGEVKTSASDISKIGGIIGSVPANATEMVTITNCINSGTVDGKYAGGIIGHAKNKITLSKCLNIGQIKGTTVGGIIGFNESPDLTLTNAFNAGETTGSGIISSLENGSTCDKCINIGKTTNSKYCTYDYQMCPIGSSGKLTSEMLGNGLQDDLGGTTNWVFTEGMYPMIKGLETSDYMIVAATPINLYYSNDPNNSKVEDVNGVTKTLNYDKNSPVEWECSKFNNEILVSFVGGKGYISNPSDNADVVLTATKGDAKKEIKMTIKKSDKTLTDPEVELTLTPTSIDYGTPIDSASMIHATNNYGTGHWECSVKDGEILHANDHIITATFIPNDLELYAVKTAYAVLTVNKGDAADFITWEPATSITYGDENSDEELKNATATVDGKFYYNIEALTVGNHIMELEFYGTNYETKTPIQKSVTVNAAIPAIAWAEPAAIDYGTPLSALQLGAVSGVKGTFEYKINGEQITADMNKILDAGTYTIVAKFTPQTSNYSTVDDIERTLVVNPIQPTVTWANPDAITYGTAISATQLNAEVESEYATLGTITYSEGTTSITDGMVLDVVEGGHIITATFTPKSEYAQNYNSATTTAKITINKAPANVQWSENLDAIIYGEKLSAAQLCATSDATGVEFTYTVTIDGNSVNAMGAILPAGDERVINAVLPESNNYSGWNGYRTIKVNPSPTTITWDDPEDIFYGTLLSDEQLNATATAIINGETVTVDGVWTYEPGKNTKLNASDNPQELTVKFTSTDNNFESVEETKAYIIVKKATPEIEWEDLQHLTYGASTEDIENTLKNATAKFDGVTLTGDYEYTLPLTTDLQAGADNITASVEFTPTDDAVNFSEVSATVNVVVDKADPTITWEPTVTEFTYGTELSDEQLNATANADGEIVYTDGETTIAAGDILDAGTHTITATLAESANYNEATATVTITVNAAETEITWETPAPIAYGTPISEIELNATANVDGTFAYTLNGENAEGQTPGIGSYSIVATFTPESSNYSGATATITLSVVSSAAEITWATPAAITYGTTLGDAQLNATSEIEGNFYYTPASGAILPAGDSTLSVIFVPDSPDYGRAVASVKLTVNKAELKVSVADTTVKLGDEMPVFKLAYSGFVNNENESALTTAPTATCAATTAEVGEFEIVVSGGESDNYNITCTNGKLIVVEATTPETPVITWAEPAAITYGTLISADILNATANVEGSFTYSVNVGDTLKAGTHELIATFVPVNNTLTQNVPFITDTVKLTVNKATLTVSVADATVNQGDDMPSFSLDYKGFVLGETIADLKTIPGAKCNATTDNAGTFDIIVSGGASDNYNFEYKNGKLTVNAKETAIADSEIKISVYPNPTADVLFVETESNADYIYVYNMAGKLVLTEANVGKTRIDLTNEPQGTYFVKVGDKTIKVLKF